MWGYGNRASEVLTSITGGAVAALVSLSLIANNSASSPQVNIWRSGKQSERLDGDIMGLASVIDGDTIEIQGQRIRIWGIDAPEGRQRCFIKGKTWRCGSDSANALARHIGVQTVSCDARDTDRYGRTVAVCKVRGQDIGAWLVRQGWALDYTRYSRGRYSSQQNKAKAASRGMWQGEFEMPWEWRSLSPVN